MKITPPRSTEHIAAEFLPNQAEQEWITKFRPRTTDSLLVNVARSCCDGFRPTDDEAQCCFNVLARPLNERDWKAEVLAVWILGFVNSSLAFSEEAQKLIVKLASPNDSLYRRTMDNFQRASRLSEDLSLLLGILYGLRYFIVKSVDNSTPFQTLMLFFSAVLAGVILGGVTSFFLPPLLFPVSTLLRKRQEKQIQKSALHTLRRWNDPRFLGTVAHASLKADASLLAQVQTTFASMVMTLTPDYYGAMPAGSTDDLCRALETNEEFLEPNYWKPDTAAAITPHVIFALNLLRALELTGSGQAAKYVRAIVEANHHREVVALAERVLPILTEREREETARTTLLRHSALPAPANEMLRAASPASTENDTETLMRPVL